MPEFNNTSIYSLYLNDNEINDITNIAELANKINSSIYLSNNRIEKIPDDVMVRKSIFFDNNRIAERPDNRFLFCKNQKIEREYELELNKENVISLPQIFQLSLNYSYNYLMDLETKNCTVDRKKGEIIINPTQLGEGHASVTIKNDQYGNEGTCFDINYTAKSNIDYTKLELGETNYKDAYIEGEDFDNSKLEVKYVTEDGVSKIVTDYEIINGNNLQEGQQNVIIKYNDIELEVPIQVFSKDKSYEIILPDEYTRDKATITLKITPAESAPTSIEYNGKTILLTNGIGTFDVDRNGNFTMYFSSNNGEPIEKTFTVSKIYKLGDIDNNGSIDLKDMLLLRKHVASLKTSTHKDWALAGKALASANIDCDENGTISLTDVLKLRRYIAAKKSDSIARNHPTWLEL